MSRIEEFFGKIDRLWPSGLESKIELSIIGCGALMLQFNYERGTKDSDVFETTSLTAGVKAHLLAIAGPDTDLHKRHKRYRRDGRARYRSA